MNIHLINSEEWIKGNFRGVLGEILLRCNNVLYIREYEDIKRDAEMESQNE